MNRPISYNGDKPYIFISYAHKDYEKVFPIISRLEQAGYRCWYDEGIDPGTEWAENIAMHLAECSYFIAFLSKNYVGSENCKDELDFAREKDKDRLVIYIEDVEVPQGMAMRINRLQAIHWHKYSDGDVAMQKLVGSNNIEICKDDSLNEERKADLSDGPYEKEPSGRVFSGTDTVSDKNKSNNDIIKYVIAGSVALLAIALIAVGIVLGRSKGSKENVSVPEPTSVETSVVSTGETTETTAEGTQEEWLEDSVHIVLTANEEMGYKSFEEAAATVRERLGILVGSNQLKFEVKEDTIDIRIPYESLGGLDATKVLRCYISRPMEMYLFDKSNFDVDAVIHVDRKDFSKVSIEHGTIPTGQIPEGETANSEYDYLNITFTDAFADSIKDILNTWDTPEIGQDMKTNSEWFYHYSYFSDDYKNLYIYNDDDGAIPALKLVKYNCTTEPLEYGFYFNLDIWAQFEKVEEIQEPGAKQVNVDALTGDTITVLYEYSLSMSTGDYIDSVSKFKKRLDALGMDYAFGNGTKEHSIVIRTGLEHLDKAIVSSLGRAPGLSIHSLKYRQSVSPSYSSPDISIQDWKDSSVLSFKPGNSAIEFLNNISEDEKTYIFVNSVPYTILSLTPDKDYVSVSCENQYRWFLEYLAACLETSDLGKSYSQTSIMLTPAEEDKVLTESDYGLGTMEAESKEIIDAIHKEYPDAYVTVDNTTIKVSTGYDVDEELGQKMIDTMSKIMEIADFGNNFWENINLYGIDEELNERARLFAVRRTNYVDGREEYYTYGHGIFTNGRVEQYKETYMKAIRKDLFWKEFEDEMMLSF